MSFHAQSSKLSRAEEIYDSRKLRSAQEGTTREKIYLYLDYFYSIEGDKFIRRRVLREAHKSAKLRESQRRERAVESRRSPANNGAAHRESVKSLEVGNALVARQSRFRVAKYAIGDDARVPRNRHARFPRRPISSPSDTFERIGPRLVAHLLALPDF